MTIKLKEGMSVTAVTPDGVIRGQVWSQHTKPGWWWIVTDNRQVVAAPRSTIAPDCEPVPVQSDYVLWGES